MRDFLTGLAIALILLLTAALLGPRLVDPARFRGDIEARLTDLVGVPVRIGGAIELQLLPTPWVGVEGLSVGEPGGSRLEAGRFEGSLNLPSLLRGEVRITSAFAQQPRVSLVLGEDNLPIGLPPPGGFAPERVVVEGLRITDGAVSLARNGDAPFAAVNRIVADIEATTLVGPFRLRSRFALDDGEKGLQLAGGEFKDGKLRLKAQFEDDTRAARVEFDGTAFLAALTDPSAPLLQGQFTANGNQAMGGRDMGQVIWRVVSPVSINQRLASFDGLELSLGSDTRAVKLNGEADLTFQPLGLTTILSTKQIDLDRYFAEEGKPATARPPAEQVDAIVGLLSGRGQPAEERRKRSVPFPLKFELTAGGVILGGDVVSGVTARGRQEEGQFVVEQFHATLPGRTDLDVSGTISSVEDETVDGTVRLEARDARRLLGWYARVSDLPVRSASATGRIRTRPGVVTLSDIALQLDDGRLTGTVERRSGRGATDRSAFTAVLAGEGIPLETLRLVRPADGGSGSNFADLDLIVDLKAVKFAGGSAGRAKGHVVRTKDGIVLDDVEVQDLAGLKIKGRSSLGPTGGSIFADVEAARLSEASDLAGKLGYPEIAAILEPRAAALGKVALQMRGDSRTTGGKVNSVLTVDGTAGGTALRAQAGWTRPQTGDPIRDAEITVTASVANRDSATLLNQFGVEAIGVDPQPANLSFTASGQVLSGFQSSLSGTLAGAQIASDGRLSFIEPIVEGNFSVVSPDIGRLFQTVALGLPQLGSETPSNVTGKIVLSSRKLTLGALDARVGANRFRGETSFDFAQAGRMAGQIQTDRVDLPLLFAGVTGRISDPIEGGGWSDAPFGTPAPPPFSGDFYVEAKTVGLSDLTSVDSGRFVYRFGPDYARIDNVDIRSQWGRLQGVIDLRRAGPQVALNIKTDLAGISLPLAPGAALRGKVDGALDVSGLGASPRAVLTSLAGGGTAMHTGVSIMNLDPEALARTAGAFGDESAPMPDTAGVRTAFDHYLRQGSLAVASGSLPIAISQGAFRIGIDVPVRLGRLSLSLSSNIATHHTDARADFSAVAAPKGWSGTLPAAAVVWNGPLFLPERTLDTGALANGLIAIAIARDLDRIETLEQDARERAFFNRRQRASDQERKRAEDDLRAQEEARRAAEQARLDEQRRQDDARRAEEARKAEDIRRAEEARRVEEQRRVDDARRLDETRRAEEARRLEDQKRRAEAQRRADEAKLRAIILNQTLPTADDPDDKDGDTTPLGLSPPGTLPSPRSPAVPGAPLSTP